MSSTPQRSTLNTSVFSPVRFPDAVLSPKSPRNDPLGIDQKVRSIVKTIIENNKKWKLAHNRGISLCLAIENIKKQALDRIASEPSLTLYPEDLKVPSEKLKTITTILKDVVDSSKECLSQLKGLHKFQTNSSEKLLKTWTLAKIVGSIELIVQAYEDEYGLKEHVMENVCHSCSKEEIVVHASVWEFETFVNDEISFAVLSLKAECELQGQI